MSCTSTEAIVTLLKNLTPAQSISEKRASETLIEISKSIKITNRMLSSLEKIYELHPSYLRESLTIMLFQNRHLNNAYDWKILPQAPDFSGPNATLERLNAHTMYLNRFPLKETIGNNWHLLLGLQTISMNSLRLNHRDKNLHPYNNNQLVKNHMHLLIILEAYHWIVVFLVQGKSLHLIVSQVIANFKNNKFHSRHK